MSAAGLNYRGDEIDSFFQRVFFRLFFFRVFRVFRGSPSVVADENLRGTTRIQTLVGRKNTRQTQFDKKLGTERYGNARHFSVHHFSVKPSVLVGWERKG